MRTNLCEKRIAVPYRKSILKQELCASLLERRIRTDHMLRYAPLLQTLGLFSPGTWVGPTGIFTSLSNFLKED